MIPVAGRESSMKRSWFTDAQIVFVLNRAEEGTSVAEVCRKVGIAAATFYSWRKKYAGLVPWDGATGIIGPYCVVEKQNET